MRTAMGKRMKVASTSQRSERPGDNIRTLCVEVDGRMCNYVVLMSVSIAMGD